MQAITVVSLFDGISVGQLALHMAGIPIDKYIAFEINKDSIKVTQYHYPATIQCGDVRNFYWESIGHCDLLIGGSPCQDLSSANRNRCGLEGSKSSLFWEYVKAKNVLKPKYFLLENVQMPARDFEIISQALGIYPVNINSSLVSAQLRNRFYWTNIGYKNYNIFGFPTCAIPQPNDKKIFLQDILTSGFADRQKSNCLLRNLSRPSYKKDYMMRRHQKSFHTIVFEDLKDKYNSSRYFNQTELERLQTLPDGYTKVLSRNKAAACIADSWTAEVIAHIFKFLKQELEKGEKNEW